MHTDLRRLSNASRVERIASAAVATALAIATALFALSAARPRFGNAREDAPERDRVAERLVYVVARPPADMPRGSVRRMLAGPAAIPRVSSSEESNHAPTVTGPTEPPDTAAARVTTGKSSRTTAAAGAPIDALTAGIARRSTAAVSDSSLQAYRADLAAGLASGRIEVPPLTQSEIDAKARAAALAVAAARGTGSGLPPIQSGGGASVPLPFGGPSRKQRERERAEYAEAMRIMARVQRKADSLIAARRKRQTDSLARVADSAAAHRTP